MDNIYFEKPLAKILPTVYDESLSYYEQVVKLTSQYNEFVTSINDLTQIVTGLQNIVSSLKENVKDNTDAITEINNKLAPAILDINNMKADITLIKASITAINGDISKLTSSVATAQTNIGKIFENYEENNCNIIENPVFPYTIDSAAFKEYTLVLRSNATGIRGIVTYKNDLSGETLVSIPTPSYTASFVMVLEPLFKTDGNKNAMLGVKAYTWVDDEEGATNYYMFPSAQSTPNTRAINIEISVPNNTTGVFYQKTLE